MDGEAANDGVTTTRLAELVALRGRAMRLHASRARTQTPMAGAHTSHLRGRGMDYAESRVYQPGDDARAIDWRRTARSGRMHTKLFREERERSLLLMMDTHASMHFGTRVRFKSVQAARAAALAAWSAARAGDRVGALAFGAMRDAVDPHGGDRGVLAVLGALARWDAQTGGDEHLSAALLRARRLTLPGSRVLLISDGLCVDEGARAALLKLARCSEMRVLIIADALELSAPPPGSYAFETPQGRVQAALHGSAQRLQFRDTLARGHRALAELCDACGVRWRRIAGGEDPSPALAALLDPRARRR
ncbi:MAG TPA: DUF58 domain-containing protein [Rhodanobacteraceae bacterium]|jgi:uncharacterized protein (DUF58 family)|nr:DUF58 domain-containing protein [Rhodanobacteraceae bacterium]